LARLERSNRDSAFRLFLGMHCRQVQQPDRHHLLKSTQALQERGWNKGAFFTEAGVGR